MAVIGALAGQRTRDGLKEPGKAPKDANALLMLHRSAVLKVSDDGKIKLDDDWVRSWACAARLGQDAPDELPARVAARRLAALRALSADGRTSVVTVIARPMGAVVTGTGAGGVRNVGIELHGTYGWPVLPGSTLKGVARSFARDEELAEQAAAAVFGAPPAEDQPAHAGAVAFLDTLPGPGGVTVAEHVLTPHTRGYRLDTGDSDEDADDDAGPRPPAEYINPVPVPFLVLTDGVFHIHLVGPRPEVDRAAELLAAGLNDIGLGAKTTSGYGYFTIEKIVSGLPGQGEP